MLYTHGQTLLKRKDLNLIPVPKRDNVSSQWKGVQHGELATTIVKRVKAAGLLVQNEGWYVNPDKSDLFGAVDIALDSPKLEELGVKLNIGQDADFSIGVRHSNRGRFAVSFAVGARISCCSNGLFSGDFILKHKHTTGLNLETVIDEGIQQYIRQCQVLEQMINGWRDAEIDDRDAAYLILNTPDNVLHWRYLEDVRNNWLKPPHEEFAPRTAWSLYNAYTETAKTLTPPRQVRMLKGIKPIFDEFVGGENRN